MSERKTINVKDIDRFGDYHARPRVYSNRVEIDVDSEKYHVVLHIAWGDLPYLMRKLWMAWREHKQNVESEMAFQEKALRGEWQ